MEFNAERGAAADAEEGAAAGTSVKADDPSLADMTRAALSILLKNDKGFFLLIEGKTRIHFLKSVATAGIIVTLIILIILLKT